MSHDLMHTILAAYGGKVTQTVITLKNGTYYGALTVMFNDQVKVFDNDRPTLLHWPRTNAPILSHVTCGVGRNSEKKKARSCREAIPWPSVL